MKWSIYDGFGGLKSLSLPAVGLLFCLKASANPEMSALIVTALFFLNSFLITSANYFDIKDRELLIYAGASFSAGVLVSYMLGIMWAIGFISLSAIGFALSASKAGFAFPAFVSGIHFLPALLMPSPELLIAGLGISVLFMNMEMRKAIYDSLKPQEVDNVATKKGVTLVNAVSKYLSISYAVSFALGLFSPEALPFVAVSGLLLLASRFTHVEAAYYMSVAALMIHSLVVVII